MQKIYKCLYCGREFQDKIPHKCNTGYRKHHLKFKNMKSFNVINYNFNAKEFEPYDVMPYLVSAYKEQVDDHGKDYKENDRFKALGYEFEGYLGQCYYRAQEEYAEQERTKRLHHKKRDQVNEGANYLDPRIQSVDAGFSRKILS